MKSSRLGDYLSPPHFMGDANKSPAAASYVTCAPRNLDTSV